jgi:hypothetical protein
MGVRIPKQAERRVQVLGTRGFYEIGYLPPSNLIRPRGVLVICQQRYEILDLFKSILRSGRFEQKAVAEVY